MTTVTSLQTGFSTTTPVVDRGELYEKSRPRDLLKPSRCTVLAGDLEHRQVIEQALGGERLLALSPGQDPISAIGAWLQGSPSQELHLVAHGAPGQISLGHGVDRLSLLQRAEQIGRWGVERIYLWSCRVGADLAFVSALQELSGARVFASAERLGLGKTLMGTSFPELAAGVAALPLELAAGDPIVVSDSITLGENEEVSFNAAENDIDPELDQLTVVQVLNPTGNLGLATLDANGEVTYSTAGNFDSLPLGVTAQESFSYVVSDSNAGLSTRQVNVTVTGQNDLATITASAFASDAPVELATAIQLSETAAAGGTTSAADAFAVSDVDYGEQEFRTAQQTVNILADSAGAYQSGGTANRVVGTYSLDASAGSNTVDAGAVTGQTADLAITDLGDANGFESLAAGETATAQIALTSEDGTATVVSNVTITGVNDISTITASTFDSDAAGDKASQILLTEAAAAGGVSAADAFAVSDVDYGEQEFRTAQQTVNILADSAGAYQSGGTANRVVGTYSLDASAGSNTVDAGSVTGQTANLAITDLGDANGFESLAAGETATAQIALTSEDGTATVTSNVTITGQNDIATITASAFESDAAGDKASAIQLTETAAAGRTTSAADAFAVSDVDYGEQEFRTAQQTVNIFADSAGAYQSGGTANRVVGTYSLDASAGSNTVDAGAVTGQTADLAITDLGGANGFESLAAGETATASIELVSEDGTATAVSNVTIIGVNDISTITASTFDSDAAGDKASQILLSEAAAAGGVSVADAFAVSDVDYGEQEFGTAQQTVNILANAAGTYQTGSTANRVVGTYSLDASASSNTVDAGAVTGQTADLAITDLGGANGFESLAAGETASAQIVQTSEDGTARLVSNVTITGINDISTITASTFDSDAAGDKASQILLSEAAAAGGVSAADAFAVSDVDYGEQEFRTAQQTVNIFADSAGSYQGGATPNRVVGTYSLDASAGSNAVDAGAVTGQTADLAITDLGGANGFESLAAGETARAQIALTSEDGTATVVSTVTITGVNDTATITPTEYKKDYEQGDFSVSPVLAYADIYQVGDIDYGQQEFSSGNYTTTIVVDGSGGRSGEALGRFSIVSDGSSSAGQSLRDAGSVNEQTADVVISVDPSQNVGRVFDFGAVLDDNPANTFGVQLNNAVNGGRGSNNYYDLSDLSVGSAGYGHLEVYRYAYDDEGKIADGSWSTDRNPLNVGDPIRLVGGVNSLAYGESASATLTVVSEDGTASSGPTTVSITGINDAPVVDTSKQLRSFELYGTFTVAEMLGFVDPSKTLITDVDYGSLPESIAITKLTPTGGFADADTGTLQRYDAVTDEWVDVDVKNVSETNKLLLKSNDILRFNANAEAYVSAALDKGSDQGGGIFDVEFRAWDRAYDQQLASESEPDADLSTLFSSGLQTISLALATSGERANATDLTYIPGQAVGIDGSNITVAGDLNIQTPVKGSVAGAGSSVYDNAVALVDGTSFGGIHGVGSANNIISDGNAVINAQAEGLVSVDASNYFDSFDDATDADATARLGIKSGPVGSGLVANGAFGVRDVDLTVGADLDLTGVVLGKTLATSRSTDGRAHAGSQFSTSSGLANTEVDVAGDMSLEAQGGILTTVDAYSRNGSALADSTAGAAYGVVSGLKGSDTRFDVGGDLQATAGLSITMKTEATMVGDGVDNNNGFSFDDEVIAEAEIGKSFGFGTVSSGLRDLSVEVGDLLALAVNNESLLDTRATAVTGDATAAGQINGNIGIYRADLQAGGAGEVDVSVDGVVRSLAETTTGDVLAKGFGMHTVGIESSDFDFKDPASSLSVDVTNDVQAVASTKHGAARSLIASSSAGMLGSMTDDSVRSVESVNVLVHDQGFAQAAGISGTGAEASAQQSAFGISGYSFATDEAMDLAVSNAVESRSNAAIVQWG